MTLRRQVSELIVRKIAFTSEVAHWLKPCLWAVLLQSCWMASCWIDFWATILCSGKLGGGGCQLSTLPVSMVYHGETPSSEAVTLWFLISSWSKRCQHWQICHINHRPGFTHFAPDNLFFTLFKIIALYSETSDANSAVPLLSTCLKCWFPKQKCANLLPGPAGHT